ncbi:unnamed protein product [Clavelina lepadiformis]|uniref:Uncharacterized protein n=1 Tax=Clavelina lepadiformis TaxID=159417 RepID=A0ABP0F348_CLALP
MDNYRLEFFSVLFTFLRNKRADLSELSSNDLKCTRHVLWRYQITSTGTPSFEKMPWGDYNKHAVI